MRITTRTLLLLALCAGLVSCGQVALEEWDNMYSDLQEAKEIAARAQKPLLIDFWKDT
jgi:hypothetical protein